MVLEFIAQAITTAVINKAVESAATNLDGELKKSWIGNSGGIKKYVRASNKKYQKTKTLLYRDRPVRLDSIYVGTRFRDPNSEGISDQNELVELLANGAKIVVSATAGAGKSVFAKFAFLALLAQNDRVPLMIELRHLNDSELGIFEYVGQELRAHGVRATNDVIRKWIAQGRFAMILDGYDELSRRAVTRVNLELRELDRSFENLALLITTRPSDEVEYFGDWAIYRVQNLNRNEAISLIEKLTYDNEVKNSFLKELKAKLYAKHKDFLSNPLLLTIMLMTYGEIAEIPSKMHVFYEHAFDTLFYRHDAAKGMYRRKIFSGLVIDDFKDVLSSVSASGYVRSRISYSNTELLGYIRKSKKIFGIQKLSPDDYKKDLLQSVCILIADGNNYTYNHRSFQEYFAAAFLVNVALPNKNDLYDSYLDRGQSENALLLAFEMKQAIVEKEFVSPYLARVLDQAHDNPYAALPNWFSAFELRWIGDEKTGFPRYHIMHATREFNFVRFAEKAYGRIAGGSMPKYGRVLTKKSFIENIGCDSSPTIIKLDDLSDADKALLENLGIIEHMRKRLQFLSWLSRYLEKKKDYVSKSDIESWL